MATEIQIRQGNQIGGCVTIITYTGDGGTVRIMIDYGMSLSGAEKKEDYNEVGIEPSDTMVIAGTSVREKPKTRAKPRPGAVIK